MNFRTLDLFWEGGKLPMVGSNLLGGKVNLRPLCDEDLLRRTEWLNDTETVRLFTGSESVRVYKHVDAEQWRQSLEADPTSIVWAIETKQGQHIGDIDLHGIDRYERSAKLTILLGEKALWNSGYGTDTVKMLLGYAFSTLGLTTIALRVYDFNKRAVRCYEKCGFTQVETFSDAAGAPMQPGEIYMAATKQRFMAENPDAVTLHT